DNYTVCKYIAEFWNTTTNFIFLSLALFGIYNVHRCLGERRFIMCYLGMLLVGTGSWLFHMTLLYEMQLLDELPMIYCTCVCIYSVIEIEKTPRYGKALPLGLLAYSALVTAIYLYNRNPVFHQVSYGLEVAVIVFRNAYLLSQIPATTVSRGGQSVKTALKRLYFQAAATFLFGFFLWNIDNIYCAQLRHLRSLLAVPLDAVLQLHGWWHVFTALGCYLCITNTQYMRLVFLDKLDEFELTHAMGIIPYVHRIDTKKAL
ncbi:alkaline ceramidase ydc1, partial [Dimargaris xerosporica]